MTGWVTRFADFSSHIPICHSLGVSNDTLPQRNDTPTTPVAPKQLSSGLGNALGVVCLRYDENSLPKVSNTDSETV